MRLTNIIFLLIISSSTVLHGMEDSSSSSAPPPRRGWYSIFSNFSEMGDAFADFGEELNTALAGFPQAIDNATKKAFDQMADAIKDDGALQNNLYLLIKRNLCLSGGIIVLTVGGSAFAYFGTRTGWRVIERNLMRPKLIIASSRKSLLQLIQERLLKKKEAPYPEMIFDKELERRLKDIVRATQNIYAKTKAGATNVKYRNLMLWGPPGTGKTMFAKKLAIESGLEWAYMSGSSFAKFSDGEGIQALDELFTWANKSDGLMLFIDEAEAFLARREQMDLNSKAYQLLTNFLNYTGERSNKFMIVFATNHKHMIDSAVHRRIDDLIELPLPKAPERFRVLKLYCNKILFDEKQNGRMFVDSAHLFVDDAKLTEIAGLTDGLSNGDLEGIINTIKTDADITDYGLVTDDVVDRAIQHALEKYAAFRTRYQMRKRALYDQLWRAGA